MINRGSSDTDTLFTRNKTIKIIIPIFMLSLTSRASSSAAFSIISSRRPSIQSIGSRLMMTFQQPDTSYPYTPPTWAAPLTNVPPNGRLKLCNLPTPIQLIGAKRSQQHQPNNNNNNNNKSIISRLKELNINLFIKRDDATGGVELGGNKLRKLEFLLAEALAQECDSVVTIGGEQSNHCRATAAASRMVGLNPNLILRTRRADRLHENEEELGFEGNILFDRMLGSTIYTCTPGEYGRLGSNQLVERVCDYIAENDGGKPYAIPVGGSNGVGSWGYINAVDELMNQIESYKQQDEDSFDFNLDHVVFATGSGGTAAGIALGLSMAYGSLGECHPAVIGRSYPTLHAVGVCDNPDYFYNTIASIADEMGASIDSKTEDFIRKALTVHHGKGRGYALSTQEELDFLLQFSLETGIALDPVYSGKALYHFLKNVVENDVESYRNKNILFWHTGGALGIYEKGNDLLEKFSEVSPVKRIDAYGSNGVKE